MTWNYRVVRHCAKYPAALRRKLAAKKIPLQEYWYGIHEVYYHKNARGKWVPDMMTQDASVTGSTRAELILTLDMMLKDARKRAPILDYDHPPWKKRRKQKKATRV